MTDFKKKTAVLLALLLMLSLAAVHVSAAETTTASSAEAETATESTLTVNASSNISETASMVYNTTRDKQITVSFLIKSELCVSSCEGSLTYDSSVLKLDSFTLSPKLYNQMINTNIDGEVWFNNTTVTTQGDFTSLTELVTAQFSVLSSGTANVSLTLSELNSFDSETKKLIGLVTAGEIEDETKLSAQAKLSEPTPEPTEPPSTPAIKLNVSKKNITAGNFFTIKARNTKKTAAFISDKKTVAAVDKNGKVTALKKGKATITVKVGSKKLTCVVRVTTNPSAKVGNAALNAKKVYSVGKNKTLTLTLKGKAATIDNSYTSSRAKVAKVVSGKRATKVNIKGISKGTATITVKVNKVYNIKIKVKVK